MRHFDPIPLVHPGGVQPYATAGGQMPGPALLAMLRGSTFSGQNPINAQRGLQVAAQRGPLTLVDLITGYVQPPGAGGGSWQQTPDQNDRNRARSITQMRAEADARERRANNHTKTRPLLPWQGGPYSQRPILS